MGTAGPMATNTDALRLSGTTASAEARDIPCGRRISATLPNSDEDASAPPRPAPGQASLSPGAQSLTTDAALLTLAQWFSPAFPVGAFSFSHGLDWLISTGVLTDRESIERWIGRVLMQGNGRTDLILLAHAWRGSDAAGLDALARALAPSAERLTETMEQGHSFIRAVNSGWNLDLQPCVYPVAVGVAARACHLPLAPAARLYLHAFAAALASAATRAVPLGQTAGQLILSNMSPVIDHLCQEALDLPLDAIGSAAFAADIASMNHETQYSRMFRT